jgi:hypothetical protein
MSAEYAACGGSVQVHEDTSIDDPQRQLRLPAGHCCPRLHVIKGQPRYVKTAPLTYTCAHSS